MINIQQLVLLLEEQPWVDNQRGVYLGTVMELAPSGKYYTPWASTNVSDEELDADSEAFEALTEQLETIGAFLETGEGDPCDLFAVQYRQETTP